MNTRAGLLLFMLAARFCGAQTYTTTDPGTLPGGNSSGAKAINGTAQVTGFAYDSNNTICNVSPIQQRRDDRPWHTGRQFGHGQWP